AWQGALRDAADVSVRIEAAAYRGRPVAFEIIGPWATQPSLSAVRSGPMTPTDAFSFLGLLALVLTLGGGGLFFARQNLRIGRGGRRGATRVTIFVLATV